MSRTHEELLEDVRRMLAGDGPEFADLFAEDGILRYPFAPPGVPPEFVGRAAIREFYRAADSTRGLVEPAEVTALVRRTDDPEVAVTEYTVRGWSNAIDEEYTFRAVVVSRARDGRFVSYDDYMDSVAMARMLGRTRQLAAAITS